MRQGAAAAGHVSGSWLVHMCAALRGLLAAGGKGWWNNTPTPLDVFQLTHAYRLYKRVVLAVEGGLRDMLLRDVTSLVEQVQGAGFVLP